MLNIVVAGPGAVGQVLGGMLALAGHDVTFLGREGSPRIDEITSEGVRVNNLRDSSQSFTVRARAVATLEGARPADLVLLTTKTYSTNSVLPALRPVIGDDTILMSLQNGVESADKLRDFFQRGIILGAFCFMGGTVLLTGVVALNSPPKVVIGDLDGTTSTQVQSVVNTFRAADIATDGSQDVHRDLWLKLLWNVGIFQWCAIRDCTIGDLLSDEENVRRVRDTMTEVVNGARINGVNIFEADIEPQIEAARTRFPLVTPSLLQDLRAGRPMEHDSFAGFISRQGRSHKIPTPINDWLFVELNRRAIVRSRAALPIASINWIEGIVSGTHIGTRKEQQDSVLVRHIENSTIAVISDGHGLVGGDVSRMAVETFVSSLEASEDSNAEAVLSTAVQITDQKIVDWQNAEFRSYLHHGSFDSGATLLGMLRRGTDICIAHVGDSRAYHISRRNRSVRQLTQDHKLSSRSLGHHWDKRSRQINATPDIIKVDGFEPGDVIVLSSDGLNVTPEQMIEIVLGKNCEDAQAELIQTSFKNSAADLDRISAESMDSKMLEKLDIDNTTVVILR